MSKSFMPAVDGYAMDEMPREFQSMDALKMQGIGFNDHALTAAMAHACDEAPVTGGGSNNPWFFLNYLAKGVVTTVTQRTTIDEIVGRNSDCGGWANVAVTVQFRELTGHSAVYDDTVEGSVPRVGRAYSYETRDIVRLAAGTMVTELESRQAAMIPGQYSPNQDKRDAIALLFKLDRDAIGHYGYRLGGAKCWGLFNDPNLDAFVSVNADGDGKTTWADKSYFGIVADLMDAAAKVQKRCKANFSPAKDAFKLVIPNCCDAYLGKTTECNGYSVRSWIKDNWKKCEVIVDPCMDNALGGENIFYIIVEKLGTSPCIEQMVPAAAFLVGSMKREAGHSELWSMATAGCIAEQPLGVGRFFGI